MFTSCESLFDTPSSIKNLLTFVLKFNLTFYNFSKVFCATVLDFEYLFSSENKKDHLIVVHLFNKFS